MKKQCFFIGPDSHGIVGDVIEALAHDNAPPHTADQYTKISQREYDNTVLNFRYEGGEWFQ